MVIIIIIVVVVLVLVIIIFIIIILIPLHYSPQSRIIYDGLQEDCTTDFLGDNSPPPLPTGRATFIGLLSAVSRCKSKSMPTVRLITTKILAILQSSAFP